MRDVQYSWIVSIFSHGKSKNTDKVASFIIFGDQFKQNETFKKPR